MNNTKWLRRALLGGAALSVMATGAQADDLAALKAQLEVLQARVSQLESQPAAAPALPPGTKLLTVRRGQGAYSVVAPTRSSDRVQDNQGYTIAITPTADMPAPVSEVTVSGEIRARAIYRNIDADGTVDLNFNNQTDPNEIDQESDDFFIDSRARLRVDGRTETAIGEVGGTIRFEGSRGRNLGSVGGDADGGGGVSVNLAYGWWQITPNWQLLGGYTDSMAAVQAGWDWNGENALVYLDAGPTSINNAQFRLTYSNGPLTVAFGIEQNIEHQLTFNDNSDIHNCTGDSLDADCLFFGDAVPPAVAGFITYDAGSFLVTASAIWEHDDTNKTTQGSTEYEFEDTDDNWMVGAGAILKLSDMFRLEAAANVGEGYCPGAQPDTFGTYNACIASTGSTFGAENDMGYWGANLLAVVKFDENMRVELGAAYGRLDHEDDEAVDEEDAPDKVWSLGASLFWDPVDQLTLGLGGGMTRHESDDGELDVFQVGFGTWFRF
jgi:hypothetical protein